MEVSKESLVLTVHLTHQKNKDERVEQSFHGKIIHLHPQPLPTVHLHFPEQSAFLYLEHPHLELPEPELLDPPVFGPDGGIGELPSTHPNRTSKKKM